MTREELDKEATEVYLKSDREFMDCQDEGEVFNLGYIAGAEAHSVQWHDLRKNQNDLPRHTVFADDVSVTVLNQHGNKVFYNFLEKVWKLESSNKISNVECWCEVPYLWS